MAIPPKARRPVHDEGSLLAFEYYRDTLIAHKIKPVNHTLKVDGDPTSLEHLLWMCIECIPQIRDDGQGMLVDKYSRWLGYIQGCLICQKFTTVKDERNRTRPWFTKPK
jgi:hypothetical protein